MRRAFRNAGWLLAGKGVGGLFSLVYLGLAARSLGVESFGAFALILSFGQAVAMIAQFQTSEIVINFGARHLAENRNDRLMRVVGFAALLDGASAVACACIAATLVFAVGRWVGLSSEDQWRTAAFAASFMFSLRGAPVGVLRLLDRFDIAALSETALPASRLFAAAICFFLMPTVDGYLAAWALAELIATLAMWTAAWTEMKRRKIDRRGFPFAMRDVAAENPSLWRFAWFTNFASSIGFLWQHAGTLAVGAGVGAAAAGGYRIAAQIAQSLSKPAVSLSRAVFPEFAQIALKGDRAVKKFASKLSLVAGLAGLAAVGFVAIAGRPLLTLVAGAEFAFAADLLLLLTIATAIEFWGFGQDPALLALGRPGVVLALRASCALLYTLALILLLMRFGALGAAAAAIIGRLVYRGVMTVALRRLGPSTASSAV